MTDIPEAGHKTVKSAGKKNLGIAFGVVFAVLLIIVFVVVFYKPSRRLVSSIFVILTTSKQPHSKRVDLTSSYLLIYFDLPLWRDICISSILFRDSIEHADFDSNFYLLSLQASNHFLFEGKLQDTCSSQRD